MHMLQSCVENACLRKYFIYVNIIYLQKQM